MSIILVVVSLLCIVVIVSVPPLRNCLQRFIKRDRVKQAFIAEDPDAHSAIRSYGDRFRRVHGVHAPSSWHVYPEQVRDAQELKQRMPSWFVEGQSPLWTLLFWALLLPPIACAVWFLAL